MANIIGLLNFIELFIVISYTKKCMCTIIILVVVVGAYSVITKNILIWLCAVPFIHNTQQCHEMTYFKLYNNTTVIFKITMALLTRFTPLLTSDLNTILI